MGICLSIPNEPALRISTAPTLKGKALPDLASAKLTRNASCINPHMLYRPKSIQLKSIILEPETDPENEHGRDVLNACSCTLANQGDQDLLSAPFSIRLIWRPFDEEDLIESLSELRKEHTKKEILEEGDKIKNLIERYGTIDNPAFDTDSKIKEGENPRDSANEALQWNSSINE